MPYIHKHTLSMHALNAHTYTTRTHARTHACTHARTHASTHTTHTHTYTTHTLNTHTRTLHTHTHLAGSWLVATMVEVVLSASEC